MKSCLRNLEYRMENNCQYLKTNMCNLPSRREKSFWLIIVFIKYLENCYCFRLKKDIFET